MVTCAWIGWTVTSTGANSPTPPVEPLPSNLSVEEAIRWALENNPELASLRQQHGIAAAAVVSARTYPFNPVLESRVQEASGPASAGISNNIPLEHILLWEVEVRGQGKYRRQGAAAGLARADWEIAQQEHLLAIRVLRAFSTLLYRQEKLRLVEETISYNEQLVKRAPKWRDADYLSDGEVIVLQSEVDAARAQLGPGRVALAAARDELRRALGVIETDFTLHGKLEQLPPPADGPALAQAALSRRADLRARQAAVAEAEARLKLAKADRFGNPTVGPAYTYDPTRISEIGVQLNLPLPVLNTHRGEILQRDAERTQAFLELRQTEIQIQQEVRAALARLQAASEGAETYRTRTLPNLQKYLDGVMKLFEAGKVNILSVIDVRRKLLQARDSYLDALLEVHQARADLAAALGEPIVHPEACPPEGTLATPPAVLPPPGEPTP
jgi:cobalt-zinc-cadmium efflux system outer membrane protein